MFSHILVTVMYTRRHKDQQLQSPLYHTRLEEDITENFWEVNAWNNIAPGISSSTCTVCFDVSLLIRLRFLSHDQKRDICLANTVTQISVSF